MSRTHVKFCGITRVEDAEAAVREGVDAIGLIRVPGSKRFIGLSQAAMIRGRLPAFVQAVLLFSDAPAADVREAIDIVRPHLLQFHGNETPEYCASFGVPYLRAVPMKDQPKVVDWMQRFASAAGLVLDSHGAGERGGQGTPFDWSAVPRDPARPLILAGGLTSQNVRYAITMVRPFAVDVASGIEATPGIKDPLRMHDFMEEVKRADAG